MSNDALPPVTDKIADGGSSATNNLSDITTSVLGGIGGFQSIGIKELLIGIGVFLIFVIVLFFIRNIYVNYLVSNFKRSPNTAGVSGWLLYLALLFASVIVCLAIIASTKFMTILYIAPIAGFSLLFFILALVTAFKKN